MKKNKKLVICTSSALALIMVIMATFAWFTANDAVKNHLETAQISDGSARIVEVFTPPTNWTPGQTVTKNVSVANDGTEDILARVSFEEMMDLLKVPASAKDKMASGDQIPQTVNPANYNDAAGYKDITKTNLTVKNLPGDVTLRVKTDTTTGSKVAYSFVAYAPITSGTHNGKFQRVTADFAVNGTEVTVSNLKYWAFDGRNKDTAAWAKFVKPQITNPAAPIKKPGRADINNPITDSGKKITLDYTDKNISTLAKPVENQWWYNNGDGFFYYIGKIAPGMSTVSLLDSLTLDPSAGPEYGGMAFDLFVNMEAIQNSKAAITSATGWNLNPTADKDLVDALSQFCV
ncbi:MAG: BsaA family SipW-dependent biofilm matrix protein [Clostridiales Family XIII bacterium]|jgi:predicted ribosomally synthesized peptide with SipW-like signal peptide|nr:BsaA family SipW-dependent biofilm matrix protein [Clostridiales Family XIII bacterium]